ncbi:unnamed protein product [Alopecurus aequalis]
MSTASSCRSGARRHSNTQPIPFVPCIPCPDCGKKVQWFESGTKLHNGWIFYRCQDHGKSCNFWHWELEYVTYLLDRNLLRGNAGVDALGAAEARRGLLEAAGEGDGGIASKCQPREANAMTRQQADALITVGREAVMMMKYLLGSVLLLCVVGVIFTMKK